jgi:hypothetical protein
MKYVLFAIALSVLMVPANYGHSFQAARASDPRDGEYIGLERMPSLSPEDPDSKWFHENTLLVRNGEAILDKVPLTIRHGSKVYQAADGGFLTYRGRFIVKDGRSVLELRLMDSMYIIFRVDQHDQYTQIKTYPVKFATGLIEFEGVRYRPAVVKKVELDRLMNLLNSESLEKGGPGQ